MIKKKNLIKIFFICPIPNDQKPITDYIKFKNSKFLKTIRFFYLNNIQRQFNQPSIIYEEGSWYDGQIWEKPFSLIKNDRLINFKLLKFISNSKNIFQR